MFKLSVLLPDEIYTIIKDEAEKENRSMSAQIVYILKLFFKQK